jgi:hypothetical protein
MSAADPAPSPAPAPAVSSPTGAGAPVADGVAPGPPPGPGVQPPFVAPPTDGVRRRRWIAIGLAGAAALLCCVGGLGGLGGLVVFGSRMVLDQARIAVTDYLTAVQEEEYGRAYGLLCEAEQASQDRDEFISAQQRRGITSFTVFDAVLSEEIVVPVDLTYDDGGSGRVRYLMAQDTSTGDMEVCGLT